MSSGRPRLVFIEGNIGVGKSTVLDHLKSRGWTILKENVEDWRFLTKRYTDPQRYTFHLQVEAATNIMKNIVDVMSKCSDSDTIVIERSIWSCAIFAKLALEKMMMIEDEYRVLKLLYSQLMNSIPDQSKCFSFYLNATPETCMSRIVNRNRESENNITLPYLAQLDQEFLQWVNQNQIKIIDANGDIESVVSSVAIEIESI